MMVSQCNSGIEIRNTTAADICELERIQKSALLGPPRWSEKQLRSHGAVFPQGQFVAVDLHGGALIGFGAGVVVHSGRYPNPGDFREVTDWGYFTNHDPEGDLLCIHEILVLPDYARIGIEKQLLRAYLALAGHLGLSNVRATIPLRNFREKSGGVGIRQYLNHVASGALEDAILQAQFDVGFAMDDVITNYIRNDESSMGIATAMSAPLG